jgi:hypothetical protein
LKYLDKEEVKEEYSQGSSPSTEIGKATAETDLGKIRNSVFNMFTLGCLPEMLQM